MSIKLPYVCRVYVRTVDEQNAVSSELLGHGIESDSVDATQSETTAFKVIFTHTDLHDLKSILRGLSVKPVQVDVFDPTDMWQSSPNPIRLELN